MNKDAAIFLCDRTGIMAQPWANAGFECWCVDLQHAQRSDKVERFAGGGCIYRVWGDIRSWRLPVRLRGRLAFGAAFTPCTELTVAGARDFEKKGGWMLADALQLFDSAEVAFSYGDFPYMLENPVGRLNSHRRAPDYSFQPWQYGDLWQKKTCLWTGGGFKMPKPIHNEMPPGVTEKIWLMPPTEDRANLRSETPPGFAKAVFEANRPEKPMHQFSPRNKANPF